MSELLPLTTLETVKDLTLRRRCLGNNEPQWPETWDQLTSITRLELNWLQPLYSELYILPAIRMESLKDVEIVVHYNQCDETGEEYIKSLIGCLPLLSRLQITVACLTVAKCGGSAAGDPAAEKADMERERLKAICIAVQSSMPGLEYTILGGPVEGRIGCNSKPGCSLEFVFRQICS